MMNGPSTEDRISCLPNAILCHILSFLPTKYAVATCVLSSTWKLVWTSLPNLCFDDRLCLEFQRNLDLSTVASTRFENFVNRVLLSASGNINKFSLRCCGLVDSSRLKLWVSFATMRNVCEIEISLNDDECIELPHCIYTCKTLEVLKLDMNFFIKTPPTIFFPSAKTLHVILNTIDNNFSDWLFSKCPALEDLSIKGYIYGTDSVTLNIPSLTLKRLRLELEAPEEDYITKYKVIIRAPNLEQLYIRDHGPGLYAVHELHSLTKAVVDYGIECILDYDSPEDVAQADVAQAVVDMLRDIKNIKSLSLSSGTMSALDRLDYANDHSFPTLPFLNRLEVEGVGACGWQSLAHIFSRMPKLESIVFEEGVDFEWPEPSLVLGCLLSHVKIIVIGEFEGEENEMKLIKYLLKNGEVLNAMIIGGEQFQRRGSKEEVYEQILLFERGSKTCQVRVL